MQISEALKPGLRGTGKLSRKVGAAELITNVSRQAGLFPFKWRKEKEAKLVSICIHTKHQIFEKLIKYSKHGMPLEPGPLPQLLLAMDSIPNYVDF